MRSRSIAAAAALLLASAVALAGDGDKEKPKPAKDGGGKAPEAQPADPRTKAEVVADATVEFNRADVNGDGYLRNQELVKGWLEHYDLDLDGRVSRTEFLEIATRPAKFRRQIPLRDASARLRQALGMFDKNKDGIIQKDEYPGDQVKFRSFDRNKDDALSRPEALAMAEDEIADIRKKMKNPTRYDFLAVFDLDGDRSVASDEFDGQIADFRKYDKDADGVVTYDELYPERMMDKSRPEEEGPKAQDLSMLDTMDANKDGKVSRDEFKGTDNAWKRLDRNEDGVVTIADAR